MSFWKKLGLEEIGHGDKTIAKQICDGFDLAGPIPTSGVYNKRQTMATLSVEDLRSSAKKTRSGIIHPRKALETSMLMLVSLRLLCRGG